MNSIELLAPAGNFEALAAAVESGADAVYLGGNKFNARAFADNFDGETLSRAVGFAHIRGVKVFVTINILLTDRELPEALEYISFLCSIGVDAIIVQDIALLKLAAEAFPHMELHCSTQMTVHNAAGASYFEGLGAKRIVLSRELPLSEIRGIAEGTGVELEVFVHGALCVSYSGQCLMSSLIGGRSGNRGRCAQPCRRKYSFYNFDTDKIEEENQGKHILSTRDLNTYNRLEELVHSGVSSLKIEGRMKKPEYVAVVVKHYRDALNRIIGAGGNNPGDAEYELKSAFNREFTEGYMFGKRNRGIVSIERPDNRGVTLGRITGRKGDMASVRIEEGFLNDGDGIEIISPKGRSTGTIISGIRVRGELVKTAKKGDIAEIFIRERVETGDLVSKTFDSVLSKKAREEYSPENRRKLSISCRLEARIGKNPVIEVMDADGNKISYTDEDKVEAAVKAPTTAEKVMEQLGKTGDTPYIIELMDIKMDSNCFLPLKQINRMRREVLQKLSEKRSNLYIRPASAVDLKPLVNTRLQGNIAEKAGREEYIAGVRSREAAESALEAGADTIYMLSDVYKGDMEADAAALAHLCSSRGRRLFIVLPNIVREKEYGELQNRLGRISELSGEAGFGLVISAAGQQNMARQLGIESYRINYSFNVFNSVAASHLAGEGAEVIGLSPELTLPQIRGISSRCAVPLEAVVYGYMPVMTTEYCPISVQNSGCDQMGGCKTSNYGIMDEKRKIFRLIKLSSCRTQLLNSDVLLLAEELDDFTANGVTRLRGDFYFESPEETGRIIKLYRNYRNMDRKDRSLIEEIKAKGFTKGHFYRGVE